MKKKVRRKRRKVHGRWVIKVGGGSVTFKTKPEALAFFGRLKNAGANAKLRDISHY